jgi:hypothetical protein
MIDERTVGRIGVLYFSVRGGEEAKTEPVVSFSFKTHNRSRRRRDGTKRFTFAWQMRSEVPGYWGEVLSLDICYSKGPDSIYNHHNWALLEDILE